MEKTYTQIVSEYLAGLKYEDIPQEAIDQAKRLTLHTVGATIGGYPLPLMKRVFDYTQGIGGVEEATIWGSNGKKVPAVGQGIHPLPQYRRSLLLQKPKEKAVGTI